MGLSKIIGELHVKVSYQCSPLGSQGKKKEPLQTGNLEEKEDRPNNMSSGRQVDIGNLKGNGSRNIKDGVKRHQSK